MHSSSITLAALASIFLYGCLGGCPDCGECGLVGGPATEDILSGYQPGALADGTPSVAVRAWAEGECVDSDRVFLAWEASTISIRRPFVDEELDGPAPELESSGTVSTYVYPSGLRVSGEWIELQQRLRVTFGEAGAAPILVDCEAGAGGTVACAAAED